MLSSIHIAQNKIDFIFICLLNITTLMLHKLLQKILHQFNIDDESNSIVDLILSHCSIYVVAFFTIEGGCSGGCGEGSVYASFTNIASQYDENEENEDNEERVVLQVFRVSYLQQIYIQSNWNVNYACCSGWYIPEIYNSREECEKEHFSDGEAEYGAVSVYNYADILRQLHESGELLTELYV